MKSLITAAALAALAGGASADTATFFARGERIVSSMRFSRSSTSLACVPAAL